MIVEKRISILRVLKIIWLELLLMLLVATITVVPLVYFEISRFALDRSIPLIFGTANAIFLGFRTNSAYERWWEARKLWGRILNDSLSLGRQIRDFTNFAPAPEGGKGEQGARLEKNQIAREVCYRQAAWTHVFNRQLKGLSSGQEIESLLSAKECQEVQQSSDPALYLLLKQGESLGAAYRSGEFDSTQCLVLQDTLSRLTDHMGGCNRIRKTNFPTHYSFFTRVFIWMFLLLLGLSLPSYQGFDGVADSAVAFIGIPAIVLIGWVFFMVDGIGAYMQAPFENNRNVVPMEAMARSIEIGLRMTLGESELPDPLQPTEGALM